MCEARIEKAAKSLEGVKEASWNKETDMLTIHYKKDKVKMDDVHNAIADAGHDTAEKKATEEAYASLPGCCQYRDDK
jgi:cation transport ATPase